MLTLHDWDPVLNQSGGFRHSNRRNRRGPDRTGCSLFWVFLFNPITVSVCADWTNTSQVMRLLWKVGQQRHRHGNVMPSQNNGGPFYTLRQGENELHTEQELLMECGEWKGRFRLTCNNSLGLPHDSVRHLSVTLAAIICHCFHLPNNPGAKYINHILSWMAFHIFIYFKISVHPKKSFQLSPQAWLQWQ